jgi:hypothetical protein
VFIQDLQVKKLKLKKVSDELIKNSGKYQDELPECTQELYENKTKDYYAKFTPKD